MSIKPFLPRIWAGRNLLVLVCILAGLIGEASPAAAQEITYRLIVAARPTSVCVKPAQEVEIRAIVVRESPAGVKRVPNIGIVVTDPKLGSVDKKSDFTDGPLRFARFIYTPQKEGEDVVEMNAVGKDPANGTRIQLSNHVVITNRLCSYSIAIIGYTLLEKNALMEWVWGGGSATLKPDDTLQGEGSVKMGQRWGLPQSVCKNQQVTQDFPLKISGTLSPNIQTVRFLLDFTGKPILPQTQTVQCDTGGGSNVSFKIPIWPITPAYLPISDFKANALGETIHWDYPMKGVSGDLRVVVRLIQNY